jgi:uncharacterized hydrophobic protein (TIGR00271 family)
VKDTDILRASATDVARMRAQIFVEDPDAGRKLSRFWLLLVLAAVIATGGVIGDSTATVIGAMIVAPLMGPILGIVLSVVLGDHENLRRSALLVVTGAAAVVAVGWTLGHFIAPDVVGLANTQVAARVSPRLNDLVVALATGAVAAIALARDDISDTLPGVAVAISLVPPLAVVGLTLEAGDTDESLGALLLFVTNVSAILVAGLMVMTIYRVHRQVATAPAGRAVHRGRAVATIIVALVVIAVPLAGTSARIARSRAAESAITRATQEWVDRSGWDIVGVSPQASGYLVRVTGPAPEPDPALLRSALRDAGVSDPVRLELIPSRAVDVGGAPG